MTQPIRNILRDLDMIISLGYRINSKVATKFRQWATARLHEYIVKGFAMDDDRLKELGGGGYWKELLDRIRDIRASEKVFYCQTRNAGINLHLFVDMAEPSASRKTGKDFAYSPRSSWEECKRIQPTDKSG